jgi:hypothetical protein
MMGWPEDLLQQAMTKCTDQSGQLSACSVLHARSEQDMNDCAQPPRVDETTMGWVPQLPGCNPIQAGPGRATSPSGCGAPTTTEPMSAVSFLKQDITGWQAVGCAAAPSGQALLTGGSTTDSGMTVEKCLNSCATKGMKFAGLYGTNVCQCGNSVDTSKISPNYSCNLPCAGDAAGAPFNPSSPEVRTHSCLLVL